MDDNALSLLQAQEISELIQTRQRIYTEDFKTSVLVVLMNYGDQFTKVRCIQGEWSGIKADLPYSGGGIPQCPNGHVLMEQRSGRKQLGWIDVT